MAKVSNANIDNDTFIIQHTYIARWQRTLTSHNLPHGENILWCLSNNQEIHLIDASRIYHSIPRMIVRSISIRSVYIRIARHTSNMWPYSMDSSNRGENIAATIRLIQSNFIKWKTTATKIRPFIFHITLAIFLCIAKRPTPPKHKTFRITAFLTFGRIYRDIYTYNEWGRERERGEGEGGN